MDDTINYSELSPLDDEEGELIDDEACFVDVRAVHGIGESLLCSSIVHANVSLPRHLGPSSS